MTADKMQLMVLDDERIVGQTLKPALRRLGCDVETFHDPREAFARIEEKEFHVVVTDILMHHIDGIEVLERVLSLWPETKVIMITGYAMMEVARRAMEKGAFDFVAKPFTPDDLRAVVARAASELGMPVGVE